MVDSRMATTTHGAKLQRRYQMALQAKTRRIVILSIVLLSCLGALGNQWEILAMGLGGLLALVKSDSDD